MAILIQLRRDDSEKWASHNPTLAHGELGLENESIIQPPLRYKVGDGMRAWNDLPYASASIAEKRVASFIATQDQDTFTIPENSIADNGLHEVKINGVEWNSRTGQMSFEQGNISIDFESGVIAFHVPLTAGDQVVIKYN